MSTSPSGREQWEYADGPTVGDDVPVTSAPREEALPGVPRDAGAAQRDGAAAQRDRAARPCSSAGGRTEERIVQADDPDLSPDTNARLTAELRAVVGSDRVEVPIDRPRASRGQHPQQHGFAATLNQHRLQLIRATAIVLTFGAIVSLITNDWWLLPLAAGIHALGTMTVMLTIVRMTTISEHPSPDVAAALAEDGVRSPDEYFSRMVEEFRPSGEAEHGAADVISPGHNAREVPADVDPADAGAQQSSAMTPTSQPSRPAGEGGTPDLVVWSTIVSLLIVSIVVPLVAGGGWLWLVTAVMAPLLVGFAVFQWLMIKDSDKVHVEGERGPLLAIVICTTIAVAIFCALVAFAFQH